MRGMTAGWGLHAAILGILAAIGVAITLVERSGPAPGGWISLRGVLSALSWLGIGAFAIASTLTFALLRGRIGTPLSYVVAVPLAAGLLPLLLAALRYPERARERAYDAARRADLGSRLVLESWSMEEREGGVVRFRVAVRALRDGEVALEPSAEVDGVEVLEPVVPRGREEARPVRAGGRVVLEADARRTAPGAFGAVHLYLDSRLAVKDPAARSGIAMRESGTVVYSGGSEGELLVNQATLRRPLPPPAARP